MVRDWLKRIRNAVVGYECLLVTISCLTMGSIHIQSATRTLTMGNSSSATGVGFTTTVAPSIQITNDSTLTISTVSVQIASGLVAGDVLTVPGLSSSFSSSWNATTGVLLISQNSPVANNASAFVTELRKVQFTPTQSHSQNCNRTIQFTPLELNKSYFHSDGTWHFYEFVSSTASWTNAKIAADATTYYGQTGYLATLTSSAEDAFVHSQAPSGTGWVGGNCAENNQNWKWTEGPDAGTLFYQMNSTSTGVSNGYTSWNSGEPNYYTSSYSTEEPYLQLLANGKWNNLANSTAIGYFVEWGGRIESGNTITIRVPNSNAIKMGSGF